MEVKSSRILLVEDDKDHAELIAHALQTSSYGYILHVTGSLSEALSEIVDFNPQLIIADALLSDGKGSQLAVEPHIKSARIPIIIISSQGGEIIEEEAKKAGVCQYVVKTERTISEIPDIAAQVLHIVTV